MAPKIKFKVITHQKIIFESEVDAVYAPGAEGRFGVLPNHIPCIYPLKVGVTKAIDGDKEEFITTMGGIFRFYNNEATILTDIAELGSDIDLTRANAAKERAEHRLSGKKEELEIIRAQLALSKAIARIQAGEKKF